MNHYVWRTLFVCGAAALVTAGGAVSPPAQADADGQPPLSVEMTQATGGTVTLGEPVLLHYTIRNASTEEVDIYTGSNERGWASSSLVDAVGRAVPTVAVPAPAPQGGIQQPDGKRIEAGTSREGGIVASREFVIPRPGKYTLSVHVRLPYAAVTGLEGIPMSRIEAAFGTVLTQDFSFTLNVTPPAPARLLVAAEALRKQILGDVGGRMTPPLVEALFSLPEAQALPSWRALASDPQLSVFAHGHVVQQLLRVHSPAAADIMADMIWNPAQPPIILASSDPNRLVEMYRVGDDALKQHITELYAMHGLAVPNTAPTDNIQD